MSRRGGLFRGLGLASEQGNYVKCCACRILLPEWESRAGQSRAREVVNGWHTRPPPRSPPPHDALPLTSLAPADHRLQWTHPFKEGAFKAADKVKKNRVAAQFYERTANKHAAQALVAWHGLAQASARAFQAFLEVAARVFNDLRKTKALSRWRAGVESVQSDREFAEKAGEALRMWKLRLQRACLKRWRRWVGRAQIRAEGKLKVALRSWREKIVISAWNAWVAYHSLFDEAREAGHKVRKRKCFRLWSQHTGDERRRRQGLQRAFRVRKRAEQVG